MQQVQIEPQTPARTYRSASFFVYTPNPLVATLTAAAPVVQLQVPIQSDSDFELLEIVQFADIAGAAQTASTRVLPLVTLQIQQSGSGIDIMPNPVPLGSLSGDGSLPFILPESKIWAANSSMNITLTRYAAATDYNIRLSFVGRKLFY